MRRGQSLRLKKSEKEGGQSFTLKDFGARGVLESQSQFWGNGIGIEVNESCLRK